MESINNMSNTSPLNDTPPTVIQVADTPTTQMGVLEDMNMPPKAASNAPYLITIIVMFFIGIMGTGLIAALRPETDLLTIIAAIFAFLTPTTASILAFQKAQETHLSVNSRLDGFIKNAQAAALATGREQGAADANTRNDVLNAKR